jgi:hypothetical protein
MSQRAQTNVVPFHKKKYGVDHHREEMERFGAEFVDVLLSDDIAWVTTKGILHTKYDEANKCWVHEWSPPSHVASVAPL